MTPISRFASPKPLTYLCRSLLLCTCGWACGEAPLDQPSPPPPTVEQIQALIDAEDLARQAAQQPGKEAPSTPDDNVATEVDENPEDAPGDNEQANEEPSDAPAPEEQAPAPEEQAPAPEEQTTTP
ncbi:MAG: hypothetical protein QGG40_14175 [Myxococcota bacterium]|jgi:hypothetical protein|nr:hypothetical protein [Myxococcota bacterium]